MSLADIDGDKKPEVLIGCYDGILRAYAGESGKQEWSFGFDDKLFIGAPISIGDLNNDGNFEIVFFD